MTLTPTNVSDIGYKTASEVRTCALSFVNKLPTGVELTGTPTVAEVTTSDLTIANVLKNAASMTIDDETVAANKAVTWKVSGGTAGSTYLLKVTCTTNASVAETLIALVRLRVIGDTE